MLYRIYDLRSHKIIATTKDKQYQVNDLKPYRFYQYGVTAFNGVKESDMKSVYLQTQPNIITAPEGETFKHLIYTATIIDYPIGPFFGNEPAGYFGGKQVGELGEAFIHTTDDGKDIPNQLEMVIDNFPWNGTAHKVAEDTYLVMHGTRGAFLTPTN